MLLTAVLLLSPAPQSVDPPTLRVIAMGDGFVAGTGGKSRGWPERLEIMLTERLDGVRIEVENEAVERDTTVTALHRLRRDVLARDPDVVVLQYGQSDAWVELPAGEDFPRVAPGAFRSNLVDLVATIEGSGARVILCEPGAMVWTDELRARYGSAPPGIDIDAPYDTGDEWGFDRLLGAYAGIVRGVGEELRVPVIAVHAADRLRGAELVQSWRADGVHASSAGHAWQAEEVADLIEGRVAEGGIRPRVLSAHAAPSRGWTLPEIDYATRPERVITVDREPGQYLGHPSTDVMPDGKTILCVYPKGHGRGPIVMKRSTDGGRTWSERLPVPESWATSKETPVLMRVSAADGSTSNEVLWSGLYPARRALSADGGVTWGELEVPAQPGSGEQAPWGGIVVMGDHARVRDGSTLAWFHDDGRFFGPRPGSRGFTVFQTRSADAGVTWSSPEPIVRWPLGHLCEPGFVRDGGTLALLLRENSRQRNSQVVTSTDEGQTWSGPSAMSGALTGDRHQVLRLPDGRLFISFRDMGLDSPRWGDWVAWVGTFEDILEGRQGQLRLRLMDNLKGSDCAYPALELLPGDPAAADPAGREPVILATTYGHWTAGEEAWIASLRIPVSELPAPLETR
ncbi:GDSL-like Lipase/Acylhydrolase [Planctomycetes bacterium Poly30]|uniref:GDSL-like Lipase/Acylhydrolase n=1 Tax=Saltatorellus ferox TaxID=2528018 RepID=A0A518ETR9_9BACT|nr:GDSL-like Lipase/Acylhydrolase [Planctomycetes bacterium Poly30]